MKKMTAGWICFAVLLSAAGADSRPNVLLFLTDDLDFDEVNFYDNESFPCHTGMKAKGFYDGKPDQGDYFENPRMLMPNIDQFASDGLVFDRFYVSSAVCMPSRYTFMTGRLASRNPVLRNEEMANVRNGRVRLDRTESNLPKALQAAGYRTGIVGKWHLGHEVAEGTENLRELDMAAPDANAKLAARMRKVSDNLNAYGFDFAESIFLANPGADAVPKAVCSENIEWVTQGALNFLDGQQKGGKPFYLYLSIQNPHNQFYDSKVRSGGKDPTPWLNKDPKYTPGGVMENEPTSMPSRQDVMRRVTAAGLPPENAQATRIDDSFGAVMKKLRERGLLDNTIVILTTDHQSRGKKTVSESNRALFVLYWKGRIQAGRTDAICSTPDLIKTILDWAQVRDAPEDVGQDGVSMANLVADPVANPVVRDSILLECQYPRAVVTPRWKYIAARAPDEVVKRMEADAIRAENEGTRRRVSWAGEDNTQQKFSKGVKNDSDRDFPGYFDPDQLYDLERDPFEQNNLANNPEYQTVLAEMKETMESYVVTMPQEFGEFTEGRMSAGQTLKEIMLEHPVSLKSGEFYASFLARRDAAGAFRIEFSNEKNEVRLGVAVDADGTVIPQGASVKTASAPGLFTAGTSYRGVLRFSRDGKKKSAIAQVKLFEKGALPASPDGIDWDVATTGGKTGITQDRVILKTISGTVKLDDLRFGRTWADVLK